MSTGAMSSTPPRAAPLRVLDQRSILPRDRRAFTLRNRCRHLSATAHRRARYGRGSHAAGATPRRAAGRRVHWPPRHLRCVSSALIMMASLVDVCIGRLVIYGAFHHRDVLSILPTPHLNSTLTLQARCCGVLIRSSSSPPLSPTDRPSSRRYKGDYLTSYHHTLHDLTRRSPRPLTPLIMTPLMI